MKIKFITCIYDNLFGTDLGGRFNRGGHYKHSLKAIMKITVADFLLYTSEEEIEDLRNFFYAECGFTEDRLQIKTYDIRNTPYKEKFELYKNLEEVKQSDRCPEIQYAKLTWLEDFNEPDYDYLFWIDAGLSSNILFSPSKTVLADSLKSLANSFVLSICPPNKPPIICFSERCSV